MIRRMKAMEGKKWKMTKMDKILRIQQGRVRLKVGHRVTLGPHNAQKAEDAWGGGWWWCHRNTGFFDFF